MKKRTKKINAANKKRIQIFANTKCGQVIFFETLPNGQTGS
jgi:hypothetical protein